MRCGNGTVNCGRTVRALVWPIEPHMQPPEPVTLPPNKTRIVATIGPASSSLPVLERMIRAGMNVARLNFSHGEFTAHAQNIENLRAASKAAGRPVAIMADLSGPKMRIGQLGVESIQ